MAHQLPEQSELGQREVFTVPLCHPVEDGKEGRLGDKRGGRSPAATELI